MSETTVRTGAVEETLAAGTLLRLATAGSVDDGKSTLVGRLLHDTKSILADQLASVERVSKERGLTGADLALLTDGLRAEREQGITIDVAYRYFATPKRSFILADCPGHVQYTRNTVTGCSTADVTVLLIDARNGVVEQTRRHLAVCALLRVPHVIVAVNKIDLVDYDQARFTEIADAVTEVASGLGIASVSVLPVAALHGDNIASRSENMPWYQGPTLLELLETLPPAEKPADEPFRFPVQYVIRPQTAAGEEYRDYRGYAGQVEAGSVRVGDEVVVLPSGRTTTVTHIDTYDGELDHAFSPQSVTLRLADDIDIARGELIAAKNVPTPVNELTATVAWLNERPLTSGAKMLLKHASHTVQARVDELTSTLDLDTLDQVPATALELNDIGKIRMTISQDLPVEPYATLRSTGSFLLIDAYTGQTLAAGMVDEPLQKDPNEFDWVI